MVAFETDEPATAAEAAKVQWDDAAEGSSGLSSEVTKAMPRLSLTEDKLASSFRAAMNLADLEAAKNEEEEEFPPGNLDGEHGEHLRSYLAETAIRYSRMYSFTVINHQL